MVTFYLVLERLFLLLIKRILSSCQREPDKEEAESNSRFPPVSQSPPHLTVATTPEVKHFTSFPSL